MQSKQNDFHFSPRPNKANEIDWQTWSAGAFERARNEDKPILLAISAVWCHWCHVMDETSYSDPAIIRAINEKYVPVRVDNDRRPDINARYNQGGWPTTAFLTPEGALLAGATYLPPEHMTQALEQIEQFYRTNRDRIEQRASELRSSVREYDASASPEINQEIVAKIFDDLEQAYDEEYGGFGSAPKFPMTEALEFLLQEYRITGSERAYDIVARSMLGMSEGGMYDHVEGGFFRYSTTRDWSVPHFEKMTEDHAALLRILATLTRITRNDRFRSTLISALGYVRTVLRDPRTHFFAGSQDADERYFELPLEDRKKTQAPYVDRTSYSNWTAAMGAAFVLAGNALEDERTLEEGVATLDALHEHMRDADGLLTHFIEPGGQPEIRGLLVDQSAYLRALIDVHEQTGEARFLERAVEQANAIQAHFGAAEGGFYDRADFEESLGNLTRRERPIAENSLLAESFLRLANLENHTAYRDVAERTLRLYSGTYSGFGIFGGPYAKAVRRYLSVATSVVLVGSPETTSELREAAHALPSPLLSVRTIGDVDAPRLAQRGMNGEVAPAAYVCAGSVCGAPAKNTAQLRDSFERLILT